MIFFGTAFWEKELIEITLWDTSARTTIEAISQAVPLAEVDFFDTSQYAVIPMNYEVSSWYGVNQNSSTFSGSVESLLQRGVHPFAEPQIEIVNGVPVMLWIGDTVGRSEINRSTLFFSTYQNGTWSEPRQVWQGSHYAETSPTLRSDGSNLYVTWQKADRVLCDNILLEEVAPFIQIAAARFDSASNLFVDAKFLTDDLNYHFLPNIAIDEMGQPTYTWIRNSENNVFGISGVNTFMSTRGEIASLSKPILSYDVKIQNGGLVITYATNYDNNLLNYESVNIYRIQNRNSLAITTGTGVNGLPTYHEGMLYWLVPNNIMTESGPLFPTFSGVNTSYQILRQLDGSLAVVWAAPLGDLQSGIFARIQNGTGWSEDILLHVSEQPIRFFDGFIEEDWNFVMTTFDQGTEVVSMVSVSKPPVSRINLDFAMGDEREVEQGMLPIVAEMSNVGEMATTSYVVEVSGPNYHHTQTVSLNLQPGEFGDITFSVPIPIVNEETEFTVQAYPVGSWIEYGATTTIQLGRPDLAVDVQHFILGETMYIATSVVNQVDLPAESTINILKNGESIETFELGEITNERTVTLMYQMKEPIDFINGVAVFEVIVESRGRQFAEMFAVADPEGTPFLLGDINGDDIVNILDLQLLLRHVSRRNILTEERQLIVADVNRDGRVDILDLRLLLQYVSRRIPSLE